MSVLPLRIYPDPVLRTVADPVTVFDAELERFVSDMLETMDHHHGAGLAAPQVGVSKRVFVYGCGGQRGHIINPVWEAVGEETQTDPEGCLSIPDIRADTTRFMTVTATGQNFRGEPIEIDGTEILARAIQHETDHLDGVLFLARLTPELRKEAMRTIRGAAWFNDPAVAAEIAAG